MKQKCKKNNVRGYSNKPKKWLEDYCELDKTAPRVISDCKNNDAKKSAQAAWKKDRDALLSKQADWIKANCDG